MRTLQGIAIFSIIFIFSFAAFGAEVIYIPPAATVTVSPGTSKEVEFDAVGDLFFIQFVKEINGTLPMSWLKIDPPFTWNLPQTVNLTITVPPGTAPDTYSGELISADWHGGHDINGNNFRLDVVVPLECGDIPNFRITSIGPDNLWAPNNSMQEVTLRGRVEMPESCTIYKASYTIDDEYDECSGEGTFSIDSEGEFAVSIPIEASRKGNDKDGRLYIIVLSAENDSGLGTSKAINVHVGHDQRK